jgi:hypothetical protein
VVEHMLPEGMPDIWRSTTVRFACWTLAHYKEYVGFSLWFYESNDFPMLQCFWPDCSNRFPWDSSCPDWVREAQPFLYLPAGAKFVQ